jgi:hypothetical protein
VEKQLAMANVRQLAIMEQLPEILVVTKTHQVGLFVLLLE